MFERFTERARQVVVLAQDEARALGHNYIGTEHILLGLQREEEGVAARVLESLGVTLIDTRAQVVAMVGQGGEPVTTGQIPFTPRGKKVLELSLREALSLGHNYIGTEHILLGLAREGDGVGMRVLWELGVGSVNIREGVIGALRGEPLPALRERAGDPPKGRTSAGDALRVEARARLPYARDWTPAIAAGIWCAIGLAVGVLLGWGIWG